MSSNIHERKNILLYIVLAGDPCFITVCNNGGGGSIDPLMCSPLLQAGSPLLLQALQMAARSPQCPVANAKGVDCRAGQVSSHRRPESHAKGVGGRPGQDDQKGKTHTPQSGRHLQYLKQESLPCARCQRHERGREPGQQVGKDRHTHTRRQRYAFGDHRPLSSSSSEVKASQS